MMNIKETKEAVIDLINSDICPLLWGHTGCGKTQSYEQIAKERNMDIITICVGEIEPSDFLGLQEIIDGVTYNRRPNWLPSEENANPNGGLIFLDEVTRGHEDIRQALYRFIDKGQIHTYKLPKGYKIVAASNPPDMYEVYEMDTAMMNRFAHIVFKPDFNETMSFLKKKHGDNHILKWISSDKSLIDYGKEFKVDDLVLSPRITEKSIKLYKTINKKTPKYIRKCLETLIVKEKVASFLSYLEEMKHINYKEILKGQKKTKVKTLLENKRMDVLSTLVSDLASHANETEKLKDQEVKNLTDFLVTIPVELNMAFVDDLSLNYNHPDSIVTQPYFIEQLKPRLSTLKRLF